AEMAVAFLGLTGPAGALPQHYTQTIIDRVRQKDHSLRDFLDLFNHRSISLFYRAWEKHHLLALLERHRTGGREDPFTRMLYCIVGLGSPGLRERFEIADETFLHYSGLFAHFPRNAISLEQMVRDFCRMPATVRQFQGTWLQLEPPEQSSLPQQAE